jgi:citrate lyase subunit beta / citryl-CoA lyase
MQRELPVWRSLLYVPANVEKFVAAAHTRGADAVVLDLEDSVPLGQKAQARTLVGAAVDHVGRVGADVVVRINHSLSLAVRDIEAAIGPAVAALSLPKVESPGHVELFDQAVCELEVERRMRVGHTRFIVLIESARALAHIAEIAGASPRIVALSLGGEDFSADLGIQPSEETLAIPNQLLIQACAARGIMPLGVLGSVARLDDTDAYLAMTMRSRRFGYVGAFCVHPRQVAVLNDVFAPTAEEVAYAHSIVERSVEAELAERGAFAFEGKMIDAPVLARARRLLDRHAAIATRVAKHRAAAT